MGIRRTVDANNRSDGCRLGGSHAGECLAGGDGDARYLESRGPVGACVLLALGDVLFRLQSDKGKRVDLMKKILLFLVATAPTSVLGWQSLAWDYDAEMFDLVDGFRVYCNGDVIWDGKAIAAPKTSLNITGQGLQKCTVTAYLGPEESGPSNEVRFLEGPPQAPVNFRTIQ